MSLSEWFQFVLLLTVLAVGHWVGDHGYREVGIALSAGAMVLAFQLGRKSGRRVSQEAGSRVRA